MALVYVLAGAFVGFLASEIRRLSKKQKQKKYEILPPQTVFESIHNDGKGYIICKNGRTFIVCISQNGLKFDFEITEPADRNKVVYDSKNDHIWVVADQPMCDIEYVAAHIEEWTSGEDYVRAFANILEDGTLVKELDDGLKTYLVPRRLWETYGSNGRVATA